MIKSKILKANKNVNQKWKKVKLGELFIFQKKSGIKAGEGLKKGDYKFFTSSNKQTKYLEKFIYEGESLIFSTGGQAGIHYCNEKFSTSNDCFVVKVSNLVFGKYVFYFLSGKLYLLEGGFRGAGLKHISKGYIQNINLFYPKNKNTQEKIVRILEKVEELIKLKEESIELLDEFLKSKFNEMFGSVFYNENKFKESSLRDFIELINGRAFKPSDWSSIGLKIIRIQNLNNKKAKFNFYNGEVEEKHIVENGDVLLSWSGTPGTSFGVFIWEGSRSVLNQHIFNVKIKNKNLEKIYFKYFTNSKLTELIFKSHGGVGLKHITKKELEKIKIFIPPITLQKNFSYTVEKVKILKKEKEEALIYLKELLKSSMSKFFRVGLL